MPISDYYGGHGSEVMRSMRERYGKEKGERVFYATANKRKKKARRRSAVFERLRELAQRS